MSRDRPRVEWQQDECPSWCVVDHRESDHPHDRKHVSASCEIPAQLLDERPSESSTHRDSWVAGALSVVMHKRDGQAPIAIYVGDGTDQRIEVDVATAERLCTALTEIMRQ